MLSVPFALIPASAKEKRPQRGSLEAVSSAGPVG